MPDDRGIVPRYRDTFMPSYQQEGNQNKSIKFKTENNFLGEVNTRPPARGRRRATASPPSLPSSRRVAVVTSRATNDYCPNTGYFLITRLREAKIRVRVDLDLVPSCIKRRLAFTRLKLF
ncbi:hypothetical protein EVAR_61373_1 [Eumeta japonica]|uniref:Uncharacterized protein n=1 Tax=Eumeta variegata TaxID=151549 RepID=A0A4C1Z901_EUMVA|nr:hypothetical protein EVAR_61373_1 [Eumeta japonica]